MTNTVANSMTPALEIMINTPTVKKLMEENLAEMKQAGKEADLEKYFTIHEQLKNAEKEIAGILGIVISK